VSKPPIVVVGAGIVGLWQTLVLSRAGHRVRLVERSATPFAGAASRFAGAMLAPYCEQEVSEPLVTELGVRSTDIWKSEYPGVVAHGSLVVAASRDRVELTRFARMTQAYETLDASRIAALEPDLGQRFSAGLYFPTEAHVEPLLAMAWLLQEARAAGAVVELGTAWTGAPRNGEIVVDCRGLDARDRLSDLRGVRGERVVIRTREVRLNRPVRLLHPRHPLYVVPWSEDRAMVGATVIESEDPGPMTVRSALELLGLVYALHPGFGEAEIVDIGAGIRPAFPDNVPKIRVDGSTIYVNGMHRHGFLLSPLLARFVAEYLDTGATHSGVFDAS
jgi:glycine oxidase